MNSPPKSPISVLGGAVDAEPRFQKASGCPAGQTVGQDRAGTEPRKGVGKVTNGMLFEKEKVHPKGGVEFRVAWNRSNRFGGGIAEVVANQAGLGNFHPYFTKMGGYPRPLEKRSKKLRVRETHLKEDFHNG